MNYTKKSFSVTGPGTKTYADNWERTFRRLPDGPEVPSEPLCATCGHVRADGPFCSNSFHLLPIRED